MKFIMLAYNKKYIKMEHVTDFVNEIFRAQSCPIHAIEHQDEQSAPIYCIEVVDTDPKDDD